jgi:glycosyltransferase involved in cell wall biosynthesis
MKIMKVIGASATPVYSGSDIRTYHLLKELNKMDVSVEYMRTYKDKIFNGNIEDWIYPIQSRNIISEIWKKYTKSIQSRQDIFFANKPLPNSAGIGVLTKAFRKDLRLIIDWDDLEQGYARNDPFFRKWGIILSEKILLKHADALVVNNHHLYELAKQFYPEEKICLVPQGVDSNQFSGCEQRTVEKIKEKYSLHGLTIGYMGVMGKATETEKIFDIYKEVKKRMRDVQLFIVGGGDKLDYFKTITEQMKLEDVIFRGWVEHDQIQNYISCFDIGLLYYSNTMENKSRHPMKLIEYMASGICSLTTNIGECEYIIEDGYDGFIAHGDMEYIDKLCQLLKDENLRTEIGKRARKKVLENYTWEKHAKRLKDFFLSTNEY